MEENLNLAIPDVFPFPFEPYGIQNDFMREIYTALENGKLGIFESPTGTGKSLSLICGALTWLENHTESYKKSLKKLVEEQIIEDNNEIDWLESTAKRIEKENQQKLAKLKLEKIEKDELRIKSLKIKQKKYFPLSEKTSDNNLTGEDAHEIEQEYLLHDYVSDDETDYDDFGKNGNDNDDDNGCLKIYYASRTHSQLAQFVNEIKKTDFAAKTRVTCLGSRQNLCVNNDVIRLANLSLINERCVELRKNETKGKSLEKENENKQTKKKTKISGCPFAKNSNVQNLSDQVLVNIHDLEQLATLGKKLKGCPYYASRKSVKDAEVVVLPYNCLLHRTTREACGVQLKGNVVIIDEAHNLLETIGNIHSVVLTYAQICCAVVQLGEYLHRFEKRLNPKNLLYIRQIIFILKAYSKLIEKGPIEKSCDKNSISDNLKSHMMLISDFLSETLTDNLNFKKIIQYIEKSQIGHKLKSYKKFFDGEVKISEKSEKVKKSSFLSHLENSRSKSRNEAAQVESVSRDLPLTEKSESVSGSPVSHLLTKEKCGSVSGSPVLLLLEFLKIMTFGVVDGRIVVNREWNPGSTLLAPDFKNKESRSINSQNSFIKFLLLNPANQFHDIIKECRSVILAGGTMSPIDEFKDRLFLSGGASPDRIIHFSCDHVVPPENVLALVLKKGPGALPLDFTYKNRGQSKTLDELGRALLNICSMVPGGIVCFFPSYEYEKVVYNYLNSSKILEKIEKKKKVYREPKSSSDMEKVLKSYSEACGGNSVKKTENLSPTGAVLFSVVGGKMSEGINFSDDLGRCVVMIGLPFPNSNSPELKEKMAYLNRNYSTDSSTDGKKSAGDIFYENLCFKAVNQSIGRAIRHKEDYASIVLLDQRYSYLSSLENLPKWIRKNTQVCEHFGQAVGKLRNFFSAKK